MLLAEETHAVTQAVSAQAVSGGVEGASWLLIGFPLFGAAVLLLGGRRTDRWGHLLGCLMPLASFAYGLVLFFTMLGRPASGRSHSVHVFEWVWTGSFKVDVGMLLDPLSLSFVLLITGVGSLIHIYSIGYMSHDENRRKFFAFLNLFVAAMLLLVLANNFVGLYVGWEGVGLASYLLIGFWQHKPSAAVAAKKAFIVNRVGDLGLSIAIMLMFATFNNVSFQGVFSHVGQAHSGTVTAIGLLLLLGACGKSAQVPLQSWLLDAMEGPTPVSALIHAATMVTAGVYLIVRSNPIFNASPDAQLVVTIVGAVTLLAGAIIGCAKDDIKKALAGSTMSQIGYMILAAGLGPIGYAAAIAHLLSHGFFKAGLFLGAGSIMHGMNEEVNMRKYGGLARYMPITFATFGLAYLAIIGFPDLAGWWTKDAIIEAALDKHTTTGLVLGVAAIVGAALTAYYMSRVMFMTFFGEKRWEDDVHPHESPTSMTVPMIVLAIGSLIGGGFLVYGGRFANFLAPVVGKTEIKPTAFLPTTGPSLILLVLMLAGVALAWFQYGRKPTPATAPRGHLITWWARRDLGGDAINETLFMRPGQWLTRIAVYFDNRGVDGIVNSVAATIGGTSGRLRRWQTGFVRSYALSMFLGAALVVAALLMVRL